VPPGLAEPGRPDGVSHRNADGQTLAVEELGDHVSGQDRGDDDPQTDQQDGREGPPADRTGEWRR
jgi:hypothetical protein